MNRPVLKCRCGEPLSWIAVELGVVKCTKCSQADAKRAPITAEDITHEQVISFAIEITKLRAKHPELDIEHLRRVMVLAVNIWRGK